MKTATTVCRTIAEYFEQYRGQHFAPKAQIGDLTMSIQVSETHYCSPRNDRDPWIAVEVGFPSEKIEALMPFVDDPDDPTGTVYGWVPVEIIDNLIAENGGLIEPEVA